MRFYPDSDTPDSGLVWFEEQFRRNGAPEGLHARVVPVPVESVR